MNILSIKENYEKYRDLKNSIINLKEYGWHFAIISGLLISSLAFLFSDHIVLNFMFFIITMIISVLGSLQFLAYWNHKCKKYKTAKYLDKFGFYIPDDNLYTPNQLNNIEKIYQEIPKDTGFDIKNLKSINTTTKENFLEEIVELGLKENNIKNLELEPSILKELSEDKKFKLYKRYLSNKLANLKKSELLEQKDEIINKIIENFNKKETLELIELFEETINNQMEENLDKSITEKLQNIEKKSLKLKDKPEADVIKNQVIKSI